MTAADELTELVEYQIRRGHDTAEAIQIAHRELEGVAADMRVTVKIGEIRSRLIDLKTAVTFCGARLSESQRERLQKAKDDIATLLESEYAA
jgi:hypothetical protein